MARHLWLGAIHCRLPQTSPPSLYSSELVPKVSPRIFLASRICRIEDSFLVYNRCSALPDDLDGRGEQRLHEHTRLLMESFDAKTLWDNYGVVPNILVSHLALWKVGLNSS